MTRTSASRRLLRSPATVCAAALMVAVGLSVVSSGCACTEKGCGDTASGSIAADLSVTFDQLRQAHLTMCLNGTCSSLDLSQLSRAPTVDMSVTLGGGAPLTMTVGATASGTLWIKVAWVDTNLAPGDIFSLTVDDSSGHAVLSDTDTATTYESYRPNGASCPPTCKSWVFDHRTAK